MKLFTSRLKAELRTRTIAAFFLVLAIVLLLVLDRGDYEHDYEQEYETARSTLE